MKIAAITMVYKEHQMLKRWYDYYGELVGHENLYVVSHGRDDAHRDITPLASHITVPRDDLQRFEGMRQQSLAYLQRSLYSYYDAVIRVDTDEFLVFDPDVHDSFEDALYSTNFETTEAWFALGMQLFTEEEDIAIEPDQLITDHAQHCVISPIYSKAACCRRNIVTFLHGAWYVGSNNVQMGRFQMPNGLYLFHLKYALKDELAEANKIRAEMSTDDPNDTTRFKTGEYWSDGDRVANEWLTKWRAFPPVDFDEEVERAHALLSKDMTQKPPLSVKGQPSRIQVQPRPMRALLKLPERLIGTF